MYDGQSMFTVPPAPLRSADRATAAFLSGFPFGTALLLSLGNVAAVAGHGWYVLAADAPTRLWPLTSPGRADILVMWGGQGDIVDAAPNGQQTGAAVYARAVAYAADARTAGFIGVVICTLPTIGPNVLGTGRPTPSEATAITDYNAAIVENTGGFDAVVRCDTPPFDDATDPTWFQIDRTHLTAAGALEAGRRICAALTLLLN